VEGAIGQEPPNPFDAAVASTILGSKSFVAWVEKEFEKAKSADRELPALRAIVGKPELGAIRKAVEGRFGEDAAARRRVSLYLCPRTSGRKLKEIGAEFAVAESAVTQASRRVAQALQENATLRKTVQQLERELRLSKV
jgi:hypothetical protein